MLFPLFVALPLSLASSPVSLEAVKYCPVVGRRRVRFIHDDYVEAFEFSQVCTKRLPDDSLQPITRRGPPAVFFRDRQPQPGNIVVTSSAQYSEIPVATASCFIEHAAESSRVEEPVTATKPER